MLYYNNYYTARAEAKRGRERRRRCAVPRAHQTTNGLAAHSYPQIRGLMYCYEMRVCVCIFADEAHVNIIHRIIIIIIIIILYDGTHVLFDYCCTRDTIYNIIIRPDICIHIRLYESSDR